VPFFVKITDDDVSGRKMKEEEEEEGLGKKWMT